MQGGSGELAMLRGKLPQTGRKSQERGARAHGHIDERGAPRKFLSQCDPVLLSKQGKHDDEHLGAELEGRGQGGLS